MEESVWEDQTAEQAVRNSMFTATEHQMRGFVQMRMKQDKEEVSSSGETTRSKTYPTAYKITNISDAVLPGDLPISKHIFADT